MPPCIEAEGVSKSLGGRLVVKRVSLKVECGSVVAILGPNGSGKSTLLQLLAGVVNPDEGAVRILGRSVSSSEARRMIGYLPQEEPLYPVLTGWENIRVLAWMRGVRFDEELARVLARELGIEEALGRKVGTYSGGMQRKLSLVAVVSQKPRVLLLDEPTSGLDPASRRTVIRVLRRVAEEGSAVLYTTHIGGDAEHADYVYFMLNGEFVAEGKPADLIAKYAPGFIVELQVVDSAGFAKRASGEGIVLQRRGGRLIARVTSAEELAKLARLAASHGLRAMEARKPSLEDAYLAATGVPLGGEQ